MSKTKFTGISNWKGGAGKSTSSVNIACELASRGYRVLLIDNDPQGDSTENLLPADVKMITGLKDLYYGTPVEKCIYKSVVPGLDIVPTDIEHVNLEMELANNPEKFFLLRKAVNQDTITDYDHVIIDTPPLLGMFVLNALITVTDIIIPVNGFFAFKKLDKYKNVLAAVKSAYNPDLHLMAVILTMTNMHTTTYKDLDTELRKVFGSTYIEINVPRSIKFEEAPSFKRSIFEHAPDNPGAEAYRKIVDELLNRWGGK